MKDQELVNHVRLAFNPNVQDWILFSNGTVVVFDNANKEENLEEKAIKYTKEFAPIYRRIPTVELGITELSRTEGWLVTGHGYGIYTYVHPQEVQQQQNSNPYLLELEIRIKGKEKRHKDSEEMKIIHISRSSDD